MEMQHTINQSLFLKLPTDVLERTSWKDHNFNWIVTLSDEEFSFLLSFLHQEAFLFQLWKRVPLSPFRKEAMILEFCHPTYSEALFYLKLLIPNVDVSTLNAFFFASIRQKNEILCTYLIHFAQTTHKNQIYEWMKQMSKEEFAWATNLKAMEPFVSYFQNNFKQEEKPIKQKKKRPKQTYIVFHPKQK